MAWTGHRLLEDDVVSELRVEEKSQRMMLALKI